jgi:hypothetical protein
MKPHRTDGVSLVFGLLFLAVTGWWLLAEILDLAVPAAGWFVAGGLILFGLLGLLGAMRTARHEPASGPPASGPPVTSTPPVSSTPPVTSTPPGSPAATAPSTAPSTGSSTTATLPVVDADDDEDDRPLSDRQ